MKAEMTSGTQQRQAEAAELIAKARALQPLLAKNALKSEQDRRASQENIDAIEQAGLFRLMVPKRLGGYQSTIRTHLEVTAALAESCGGTAWVTALSNVCAWFTGTFTRRAQEDVWGSNPNARVAGVLTPSSESRRVDGGLVVSGKWYWSSGSLHADWICAGIIEHDKNGAFVGQYLALMPRADITIEDTWYTVGMRASGSNCVVAKDVFIPDYRMLDVRAGVAGDYPTEFKDEAEYRAAFVPVAALVLVGAQLGIGRAALKYVIEKAPQRNIAYTSFDKQSSSVMFQAQIAQAAQKIDTAHLHAFRAAADIDDAAQRGELMDYVTRARVRADTGTVATSVLEALNLLISAHGAGTFAEASPLQRMWRDANTAARHAIVMPEIGIEVYGKALLGVENTVTQLV
ncbi:MAG: acyl-CoA dehydrogenase family protein [Pseudomonadota bacterium]